MHGEAPQPARHGGLLSHRAALAGPKVHVHPRLHAVGLAQPWGCRQGRRAGGPRQRSSRWQFLGEAAEPGGGLADAGRRQAANRFKLSLDRKGEEEGGLTWRLSGGVGIHIVRLARHLARHILVAGPGQSGRSAGTVKTARAVGCCCDRQAARHTRRHLLGCPVHRCMQPSPPAGHALSVDSA